MRRGGMEKHPQSKRRRTGDVERDDIQDRLQTPNAHTAAGGLRFCSFLQSEVTRDRHVRMLKFCNCATEKSLSVKLEKMEREGGGVQRSQEEMQSRMEELKAKGRDDLIREYIDRLHGSTPLSDEYERKKLMKDCPLREEDEEEHSEDLSSRLAF